MKDKVISWMCPWPTGVEAIASRHGRLRTLALTSRTTEIEVFPLERSTAVFSYIHVVFDCLVVAKSLFTEEALAGANRTERIPNFTVTIAAGGWTRRSATGRLSLPDIFYILSRPGGAILFQNRRLNTSL